MSASRPLLAVAGLSILVFSMAPRSLGDDGERLLSVDHYVGVRSAVPATAGQTAEIYVREVVRAGTALAEPAAEKAQELISIRM